MKDKDRIILEKILKYVIEIKQFIVDCDYEKFVQDRKTTNACVFDLSQIGELVTKISEETIKRYPNIEWRGLKGLRNRIVHDYDGINLNMVWRIFGNRFGRIRKRNRKDIIIKEEKIMKEIIKKICRVVVAFCIFWYCKIVYRMKIVGKENIPKEGALLFCGNHRTYLDPPLITVTAGRKMSFMAKEELKSNPLMSFLCFAFDGIWVKRDSKDIGPLKTAMKLLKNGGCIGIFPEGTRNGMEKNEGKLKNGAAYMALKTGAKIVPIGIQGEAKPFTKNTIIYGKPLDFSEYTSGKVDKEVEEKVSEELKQAILALTNQKI